MVIHSFLSGYMTRSCDRVPRAVEYNQQRSGRDYRNIKIPC